MLPQGSHLNALLRIVSFAILLVAVLGGYPHVVPTQGEPWPAPQQMLLADTFYYTYPAKIRFKATKNTCLDLSDAFDRYEKLLTEMAQSRQDMGPTGIRLKSVQAVLETVEVWLGDDCASHPTPMSDMDEEYLIKINTPDNDGKAQIIAASIWGIYRGLETFTHLFYYSEKHNIFQVRHGMIRDYPRYTYRGLLLDTSRHFLPKETLKQNIELMAYNKLNVFHWHIVDDPSFPFESETYPQLSQEGAYRKDMVYTQGDVLDIIEFARKRGIRVIPEFDTPGHVRSWGAGVSGLLTTCYNTTSKKPDGTFGPLDPSKGSTFNFVKQLLKEVTNLFPDNYIHLGGDEVRFGFRCWLSNPGIKTWMAANNFTTAEQLESYYIKRLLRLVSKLPTKPEYIVWQDVIDNNITVTNNTVVHVWKDGWQKELHKVTKLNHRAILSSPWYLNRITYGIDWPELYTIEPENFNGTATQRQLVVGGEACMWGEFVDATNLVPRLWPRASAVAERLWSDRGVRNIKKAASRMEEHRCRMLQRGYAVEPANGPGFC